MAAHSAAAARSPTERQKGNLVQQGSISIPGNQRQPSCCFLPAKHSSLTMFIGKVQQIKMRRDKIFCGRHPPRLGGNVEDALLPALQHLEVVISKTEKERQRVSERTQGPGLRQHPRHTVSFYKEGGRRCLPKCCPRPLCQVTSVLSGTKRRDKSQNKYSSTFSNISDFAIPILTIPRNTLNGSRVGVDSMLRFYLGLALCMYQVEMCRGVHACA